MSDVYLAGDDHDDLAGIGSKYQKARKKVRKAISGVNRKIHKATIPKQIRMPLKKFEAKNRENIKKVGQAAAMAIATVATGGAAAVTFQAVAMATAKSLATDAVMNKAKKAYTKRTIKKEEKKIKAEIAQLQKETDTKLEMVAQESAQQSFESLPIDAQNTIKAGVAQYGPEWLKSKQALMLMKPAIVDQAVQMTGAISPSHLAPTAAADIVSEQVDETVAKVDNKNLYMYGGAAVGALLLIMLIARKK